MFFVVGNSRSGTTMMGRILGQHSEVFMFHELHFFEQLWDPSGGEVLYNRDKALQIVAILLSIQREGYMAPRNIQKYSPEARDILNLMPDDQLTPDAVFREFLVYEAAQAGARIPCEQTPRNLFFSDDIFTMYPDARIVEMVRDPRDVLLSQKHRWKRRFLGNGKHTILATLRAWANYHPYTTTKIWLQAVRKGEQLSCHERFTRVIYETLVNDPEVQVQKLCDDIGLEFEPAMLNVPRVGSSTCHDSGVSQISADSVGRWQQGGISQTEKWICQHVAGSQMSALGYQLEPMRLPVIGLVYLMLLLPCKLLLAIVLNFHRVSGLRAYIARRT